MKLILHPDFSDYLERSNIIDYDNPFIVKTASAFNMPDETETAKRIYEFVRDEISHSADINGTYVTCNASEVLNKKEGICYAKSHLLAALMRYNGIPCGFCYQLLRLNNDKSKLVLHGLNAIYLKSIDRWIRLDARGNKMGVNAEFSVNREILAYDVRTELDEVDYHFVYSKPDENAVAALKNSKNFKELWANLPTLLYNKI